MATDEPESALVVILDTNPTWWGQRLMKHDKELMFTQCVDNLMIFCNSHLMMNHRNKLAVIAAHTNNSKFLYPRPENQSMSANDDIVQRGEPDGKYELFAEVNATIKEEISNLVLNESGGEFYSDALFAGAMAMALCYINRLSKEAAFGSELSSRILIIKGSDDNPSQYMNFMSVTFTAQKQNVVIDACILEHESGLLQQACDITGGVYLKIPQISALLQYLVWVFLPDPSMRTKLTLPPQVQVDYRAACFCHRQLIDVGHVCSVCLSIFCKFTPICTTCQTPFKFLGPPKLVKKKVKKT